MKREGLEAHTELGTPPTTSSPPRLPDESADLPPQPRRPATREEAEDRYVAARDAWTRAMRAASGGRPADLAALAITQEAYEKAAAERDAWTSGERAAIPIRDDPGRRALEIALGQELAWRRVQDAEPKRGLLGRLRRRFGR